MRKANSELRTLLNKTRELHGEEHALIDVFSRFEVADYLAIPVRGKQGPPMLDVAVRLERGEPYSFVLVEAKGGRDTPLGQVTRKVYAYDAAGKVLTLVQYTLPEGAADYVSSMWELQKEPYAGDVVNSYNDGPPAPEESS